MATVAGRTIYELAQILSKKIDDKEHSKPYVAAADINANIITFSDAALSNWFGIINKAIESNRFAELLKAILHDYKDDRLQEILEEYEVGYRGRLKKLANAIRRNQCILFLGPSLLRIKHDDTLKPFNSLLAERLKNTLDKQQCYYDKTLSDNLAYLAQRYLKDGKNAVDGEVGNIGEGLFNRYLTNNQVEKSAFQKLAIFPWKVVLNVNPDTLLADEINARKPGSCKPEYYTIANDVQSVDLNKSEETPSRGQTFFYNLFGSFESSSAILYTEADFLRFAKAAFERTPKLHSYAVNAFDRYSYYLFIGFDYDQWYFKILAKVLNLEKEKAVSIHSFDKKFNECNTDFFEQEYKFYLVADEIDKFLQNLVKAYKELEEMDN